MKNRTFPYQQNYFWPILMWFLPGFLLLAATANAQPDYVTSNGVYTGQAEIGARQRVTLQTGFKALRGCQVRVFTDPTLNLPDHQYDPLPGNTIVGANPNNDQNYILTTTLRAATTNASQINQTPHVQVVEYIDGLGRPLQTVIPKGSPQLKDIVTPVSYDDAGRVDRVFLAYTDYFDDGRYYPHAKSDCIDFYENGFQGREADLKPYADILYDNSPLNRVTGEIGMGTAWQNNPTAIHYKTNNVAIAHWEVTGASPGVFTASSFPANSLYLTENIDEDGNTQLTYTDKLGQTVRVEQLGENDAVLRTSYIYDDFGLLRCVVPPKANSPADTELCYFYNYDHRKRLIEKRLPGAEWIYFVYDKRDRIALWQDGVQRTNREWHFHLYDAHNRPVINGFVLTNDNPNTIRNTFNAYEGTAYETWTPGGPLYGYSNQSFPVAYRPNMAGIRSLNWYDNYDFKQLSLIGNNYNLPPIPPGGTITPAVLSTIKGMVTGSLEKVDDMPGLELVTVNYYDVRRRLLCAVSDNHLGGRNNVFIGYTFNDEIREKIETHYINGQPNDQIVLLTRYTYDHQGRLLEEKLKFGDEDFVTISALEYNEIGDVLNTYLHGGDNVQAFNQKIKNTYNIRGWLRKINDPAAIGHNLFALDLRYEAPETGGAIATIGRFNGNISQMLWNSKTDKTRAYGFDYDPLNRLTGARYGDGPGSGNNQNHFRADFDYDVNGNITNLKRRKDNTLIDDLSYTYYNNGNRLQSVADATGNTAGYAPNSGQYIYDANGNMTYDPSKKITVSYNPLNLPQLVEFDNSDFIEYTYTATGTKLRKTVTSWKTTTGGTTDYSGQFLYQDNELSCIFTPVGRIVPMQYNDETFWKHEYNLTDHLGNTRIVFAAHPHGQPEVMQQTSYYPFGMTLQQQNFGGLLSQPNKLLYNGKELQDDELAGSKLDWYDYGARFYDAQLGRWHSVDPLAEQGRRWSPYTYVFNNPLSFIDPDGRWADEWNLNTGTGEMTWMSDLGGDEVQFVNFVTPHENGALEWHGTTYIDGGDIFPGPMANNYDGDFTFGVSNKDLWSDIPNEYQGHYMAWDLKLRYVYSNRSNQTQINSIRSQEAMGLDRREMIWNSSDEYKRIVNKYDTDASFVMAHEYGMMPLPVGRMGTMSYTQRSLALGRSSYFKGVSGTKGSNFFKNIAVYSTQPKLSNNPWIRFLQMNKGQYSGKGWLNNARQDYYNLKAAGGL